MIAAAQDGAADPGRLPERWRFEPAIRMPAGTRSRRFAGRGPAAWRKPAVQGGAKPAKKQLIYINFDNQNW